MPELPAQKYYIPQFVIEPLQPFGEKWIPLGDNPVEVDRLIESDIENAVRSVRIAKLVVIENSTVSNEWPELPAHSMSRIPQMINDPSVSTIPMGMMHLSSDSPRQSFALDRALHIAGQLNIQKLKDRLAPFPQEFLDRYGVNLLVEAYEQDEPYYEEGPLSPRHRVAQDLARRRDQFMGALWVQGQTWPNIIEEGTMLQYLHIALNQFKLDIARDVEKLTFEGAQTPQTTVLWAQDNRDRWESREHLVFNFAEEGHENSAKWNFVFGNETRSGMNFKLYSSHLAERRSARW